MKTRKWVEIKTRRVIERQEKVEMNQKLWALIPDVLTPEEEEKVVAEKEAEEAEELAKSAPVEEESKIQEFSSLYFLKKNADTEYSALADGKEYSYVDGSWKRSTE